LPRRYHAESGIRSEQEGLNNAKIKPPLKRTFDAEGAILKEALIECLSQHRAALEQLADAAKRVDQSAFGSALTPRRF
jgi:hypothetical protein